MKFLRTNYVLLSLLFISVSCGSKSSNLGMTAVDQTEASGFSIYRSGQPEKTDVANICKAGIKSVFALNGLGDDYAAALHEACPNTTIVYNFSQDADTGIDHAFLEKFDQEVQQAQSQGYGILFHCSCGCHRTGRLAAYYRLKYNGWTVDQAADEMLKIGKSMDEHPGLVPQVKAYAEYIQGKACTQETKYCVK